jgi:hypothetical protein
LARQAHQRAQRRAEADWRLLNTLSASERMLTAAALCIDDGAGVDDEELATIARLAPWPTTC